LLEQTAAALDVHGPSTLAVRVQVYLANVFAAVGSYAEMLAAAERAAELARLTGDVRDRADAQERRGTALSLLGRVQESREALEEAAELAEAAGDLDALTVAVGNLGVSHDRAGEMVEALRLYQRALELARRSGFAQRELFSHVNVAAVLATTGEWAAAHEHLERAQEIAAVRGTASSVAAALPKHLGMLALKEGNWQEASQQLRRAAELAEGANWMDLAEAQESLAALAILEGRADEARDRLQGVVEHEAADLPSLLPTLAWAHLELGETERALELAQRAAREARERQALYSMPEALRVEGMALRRHGRLEEARAALTEGRERAAAMPKPYDEAGILVELALLERDEGDAAAARAHLEAALRIFRRLGAKKDVERAERELAARP
jgi:tetratricopeptide (TPR) repeat protein